MPDPDLHDPVDDAYRRAEAVLSDDEARAARRARVLAAVAAEAEAAPRPAERPRRLHPAWFATAAAVGLSVVVAVNIPRSIQDAPAPPLPPSPPTAPPLTTAAPSSVAAQTADTIEKSAGMSVQEDRAPASMARSPPPVAPLPAVGAKPVMATPPPPSAPPLPLPPVPAPVAESPSLTPRLAPPPAAPAPPAPSASVFAERDRAAPQSAKALSSRQASPAGSVAGASLDPAERMRAAAAAGRTAEVEALLAQGVPVDAADGEGETALMKSVRAGHPATAALLRRQGANLDYANKSGETARDLAAAKADAQLDKALNLPR